MKVLRIAEMRTHGQVSSTTSERRALERQSACPMSDVNEVISLKSAIFKENRRKAVFA
jgi:hypothetical protein